MEKLQQTYNLKQTIKEKNKQIEELKFFVDFVKHNDKNLYKSALSHWRSNMLEFE